jgi:thiol-disulfide isomerase/thioredoxin
MIALSLVIFPACGIKSSTNTNAANGSQAGNPELAKSTHAFPEMPANVMNSRLKGADGESFTLKQYEGKVLLLNLWATWCGPCRMEMPELIKIENEYKDKDVMVIGLDVESADTEDMVKTFIEKNQLNYKIAWSTDEVHSGLLGMSRAGVIPQSFLVTKDGRLAGIVKGYDPNNTPAKVRAMIDDALARTTE